jgi:hypothetical protein
VRTAKGSNARLTTPSPVAPVLFSDWKNFSQKATQDLPDMDGLASFAKTAGTSLSDSFKQATKDIDVQGMQANLSSMASSTSHELINFGKELSRDAGEASSYVAAGAGQAGAYAASATREIGQSMKSLSPDRVATFFALGAASSVMYSLAFFYVPVLVLFPAKFAVCFSVASACSVCAVGALRGAQAQAAHMVAPERLVLSLAYVGALLGTLYCSLVLHSYVLTILSSVAQAAALLYYQVSYFPYGAQGLKTVLTMGVHIAKPLVFACGRSLGLVKPKSYLPL